MNKFKIGDFVKVKDRKYGHHFKMGEVLKIIDIANKDCYICKSEMGDIWALKDIELERIEKIDNWKVKIKINYEFDEETEITNCKIIGGREQDLIYGIMDLILMLYNKVEDKKCLIGSIRELLDNIEKGKI